MFDDYESYSIVGEDERRAEAVEEARAKKKKAEDRELKKLKKELAATKRKLEVSEKARVALRLRLDDALDRAEVRNG